MSLRARILLLIAGTVAALTALLLIALNLLAAREVNAGMRQEASAAEAMFDRLLTERTERLKAACRLMATQPTTVGSVFGENSNDTEEARNSWETMTDIAEQARQSVGADTILITDSNGVPLGETGVKKTERDSVTAADLSPVADALAGREGSGIVLRHSKLMLAVSVPITAPVSGYVRGTFTAFTAIGNKLAIDLRESLGKTGIEVAFLENGRVVGASLAALPEHVPELNRSHSTPSQIRLSESDGAARYLALYRPLPASETAHGADVGFVTLRDYAVATAFGRRIEIAFAGLSAFTLIAALCIGTWAANKITRPLDGVVAAAQMLREGRFPERFPVSHQSGNAPNSSDHDEVRLLQDVFNEMSDALRASQERLLALIDTDALTGLDNHRRFQERLEQEVMRGGATGDPLSLLLIDIDKFKQFNHQCGHAAGDAALRRLAELLENQIPQVAIAARYGGEEFAVIAPCCDLFAAEQLAEKLRLAHARAEQAGTGLTISIGFAELSPQVREAEALTLAAELALSQAKLLGRARTCRFDNVPGADGSNGGDPYHLEQFLRDNSLATIQALAAAVDAKDPYTQGHSTRVALLASRLAARIGLSREEAKLIHTTGTLHDVGKIGVPDAILLKPARLTGEERALMETHPVLGELIVRKAPQLAATLPGVRHHHERWDGRGYPDGLCGQDIPRIARILAVADTFDAMTSDRPYRSGQTAAAALQEIAKCAGTQFDPEIAAAFVEMLRPEVLPAAPAEATTPADAFPSSNNPATAAAAPRPSATLTSR